MAEWRSNLGAFEMATDRAIRAGLVAAAEVYAGAMREKLQEGYTSGKFVTGATANSVQRGDVERSVEGYGIAVGSVQVEPPVALLWEMGHMNLFTGKFERQERWAPTLLEMREQLVGIVATEIRAVDGVL